MNEISNLGKNCHLTFWTHIALLHHQNAQQPLVKLLPVELSVNTKIMKGHTYYT